MKSTKERMKQFYKKLKFFNCLYLSCSIAVTVETVAACILEDWHMALGSLCWAFVSWINWGQSADMQRLLRLILIQKEIIEELLKKKTNERDRKKLLPRNGNSTR